LSTLFIECPVVKIEFCCAYGPRRK
jgi:hypothetical protein